MRDVEVKPYKVPPRACNAVTVAELIGRPLSTWSGNCTGICTEILKAGVVKGELRRGLWVGHIAKRGTFAKRPFTGHTWIRLPDGRVYDPTRFAFAATTPNIYISDDAETNHSEYDFGGNEVRQAFRQPFPSDVQPDDHWLDLKLSRKAGHRFFDLVGLERPVAATSFVLHLTWRQAAWLANCSLEELGEHAAEVYRRLVRLGHGALIPFDNREAVLGKTTGRR